MDNKLQFRPAIPTMALGFGSAGHSLPLKIEEAAKAGFEGVEIFFACLDSYAQTFDDVADKKDKLRSAAKATGDLCVKLNLHVVCLQPFLNYDGIIDEDERKKRVEEFGFWLELTKLLGTNIIQIPACFRRDQGISGDADKIASDLRELADLAAQQTPIVKLAYENLGWSTFTNTWQLATNIVNKVNRPNFGLCLDAFNIAAHEYADPEIPGGIRPDGHERLQASLDELLQKIPVDKIWFAQVIDCEKLDVPLSSPASPFYVEGQPSRMSWSRNCRVYPFETDRGAYLPIAEIAQTFVKAGYRGWFSLELWNRFVVNDTNPNIPKESAERGMASWKKMLPYLEEKC